MAGSATLGSVLLVTASLLAVHTLAAQDAVEFGSRALSSMYGPDNVNVALYGDVDKLGYVYAKSTFSRTFEAGADGQGHVMRMIVDSSSKLTYAPCTGCTEEDCGSRRMERLVNELHQTMRLGCHDQVCPASARNCLATNQGRTDDCFMELEYPDENWLEGNFVQTFLNLSSSLRFTLLGCVWDMSAPFRNMYADGSLALAQSSETLAVGIGRSNGWSMCLAPGGYYGGSLEVGKSLQFSDAEDEMWIELHEERTDPLDQWKGYYVSALADPQMSIGNSTISIEKHTHALINTGSSLTFLPEELFNDAREALFNFCDKSNPSTDADGADSSISRCAGNKRVTGRPSSLACYDVTGTDFFRKNAELFANNDGPNKYRVYKLLDSFPNVTFHFHAESSKVGGPSIFKLSVHPKEYMFYEGSGVYCAGIMRDTSTSGPTKGDVTLGVNVLRGWNITMDLRNFRHGTEECRFSFKPCLRKFDLAVDQDTQSETTSNSWAMHAGAQSGVAAFFGLFSLTMCLLCCIRCLCVRRGVQYEAVNEFGTGNTDHARAVEIPRLGKFSIGSDDDLPSDDEHDELALEMDGGDDDEDEDFVSEAARVRPVNDSRSSSNSKGRGGRNSGAVKPGYPRGSQQQQQQQQRNGGFLFDQDDFSDDDDASSSFTRRR